MCFNETTSLAAFSVSVATSSYLLYNGIVSRNKYDLLASIITIMIGSMQLVEFFLWRNQDCSWINHFLSLFIMVILYLQASISSIAFVYLFDRSNPWIQWLLGSYTIWLVIVFYWLYQKPLCSQPSPSSCRLVWSPFHELMLSSTGRGLFAGFLFFYYMLFHYTFHDNGFSRYPLRYRIIPIAFFIALIYSFIRGKEYWVDIFGSFWCFLAVSYGIVCSLHI